MHLSLARDEGAKPVDALHIHASAPWAITVEIEEAIWGELGVSEPLPVSLGPLEGGARSEPLSIVQLLLLCHLLLAKAKTRRRAG